MNHIFISYSRKNKDIVYPFAERLRREGVPIWLDVSGSGTGIPFSTKWFSVIEEALHLSSAAIIFRSPEWEASEVCGDELALIKSLSLPRLELSPGKAAADPDTAALTVQLFIQTEVNTPENERRTLLFASAYEYMKGVDPYELTEHKSGAADSLNYLLTDIRLLREQMNEKQYAAGNPKLRQAMEGFLAFSSRTMRRRAGLRLLWAAMALSAVILGVSAVLAAGQGTAENERTYAGLAAAGRIASLLKTDPEAAALEALSLPDEDVTVTSYFSLDMNVVRLLDTHLPLPEGAESSARPAEGLSGGESGHPYEAAAAPTSGGILLTEGGQGISWNLVTEGQAEHLVWSEDGRQLAYACGRDVFVYDAAGRGAPLRLSGNYARLQDLSFVQVEEMQAVRAVTENGDELVWALPFTGDSSVGNTSAGDASAAETSAGEISAGNTSIGNASVRRNVQYGKFLADEMEGTAVFLDGNQIVIRSEEGERVLAPEGIGDMNSLYFDVSDDGGRLAALTDLDGETGIVCVDLADGEVLALIKPEVTPTALVFDGDPDHIAASAYGVLMLRADVRDGSLVYGEPGLYTGNLARLGEGYILTDYYGNALLAGEDMQMSKDLGSYNYVYMPCFSLAVNEDKGYLYTVNRGSGAAYGCTRFRIGDQARHVFVVPEQPKCAAATAAAVSEDGCYVAYGYPDGCVRVYEQDQTYLVMERQCLTERVSSLAFSGDGARVYMLGASGTVRETTLPEHVMYTDESSALASWHSLKAQLLDKWGEEILE